MSGEWFGEPWPSAELRAPVCENDAARVLTPIGRKCAFCAEFVEADHRGTFVFTPTGSEPVHAECSLRNVVGNHIHVAGGCSYTGQCNELSNLSYRQEALEVWRLYRNGAIR